MLRSIVVAGSLLAGIIVIPAAGAASRSAAPSNDSMVINKGVVELETGSSAGISVRIAEDLANLVNDGATRRLVPVVGRGSLGNLNDLKLLRGIDVAIIQTDTLDYIRERQLFPGVETSITYITKLYNEEFHLLARSGINSVTDLANQKVNVDLRDSGTAITASRVFDLLKLPVALTNDPSEVALEKLRSGEIAALGFVSGKPAPFFRDIKGDDGLHLLSIPFKPAMAVAYLPARLTAADYPGLIPQDQTVDTVGVGTVLAAANLQQCARTLPQCSEFRRSILYRVSVPARARAIIRNGGRSSSGPSFPAGAATRPPSNGCSVICRSSRHRTRRK